MASDFETVIAKCDGCKYEEECREMPPCILDAYNKGRADQKEEDNEFFSFEGAWELEKKKCRADAIDKVIKYLDAQFLMQNNPNSKFVETIILHRDFIDELEKLKEQE